METPKTPEKIYIFKVPNAPRKRKRTRTIPLESINIVKRRLVFS